MTGFNFARMFMTWKTKNKQMKKRQIIWGVDCSRLRDRRNSVPEFCLTQGQGIMLVSVLKSYQRYSSS